MPSTNLDDAFSELLRKSQSYVRQDLTEDEKHDYGLARQRMHNLLIVAVNTLRSYAMGSTDVNDAKAALFGNDERYWPKEYR